MSAHCLRTGFLCLLLAAPQLAAQSWIQLSPAGGPPPPRENHSAVYDPASNRMIVYGGNAFPSFGDLWVLTRANGLGGTPTWIQIIPAGSPPLGREGHRAVYDPGSDTMVVFGGRVCTPACFFTNEVWRLANASGVGGTPTWSQLFPAGGPPPPRWQGGVVYDPATDRMVIQAGQDCSIPGCLFPNDVWVLSGAAAGGSPVWTKLLPAGPLPINRVLQSATFDGAGNRLTVFGGSPFGVGTLKDVWVLSGANGLGGTPVWTQLAPTGGPPSGGFWSTGVYDPGTNRMIVFGGAGPGRTNDTWILDGANGLGGPPAWSLLAPAGTPPAPRFGHTAVYDGASNRMTVFGGRVRGPATRDVWVLTEANGVGDLGIEIDVKPGSDPNSINPRAAGVVPVALLTTSVADGDAVDFDAWDADPATLAFGPAGAGIVHAQGHAEDVDGDGDLDMVVHFRVRATGIACGATEAELTGETFGGRAFAGSDAIRTTGCKAARARSAWRAPRTSRPSGTAAGGDPGKRRARP